MSLTQIKAAVVALVEGSAPTDAQVLTGPPGGTGLGSVVIVVGDLAWVPAPVAFGSAVEYAVDVTGTISASVSSNDQDAADAAALGAYEALATALAGAHELVGVPGELWARLGPGRLTQATEPQALAKGRHATLTFVVQVRADQ